MKNILVFDSFASKQVLMDELTAEEATRYDPGRYSFVAATGNPPKKTPNGRGWN